MLRKILAVLFALTLLLSCAGAEEENAENPFIGVWGVMYYVVDGSLHTPEELDYTDILSITGESVTAHRGDDMMDSQRYQIAGNTLLCGDLVFTLEGQDLLVCHDAELSVLLTRIDPLVLNNPFIGTWTVLLLQDGDLYSMEDYGETASVAFEAKEILLIDGEDQHRYPCVYADGRCQVTAAENGRTIQYTAFIREDGLLVMTIHSPDSGSIGYVYCAREDEQPAPAVLRFYGVWREIAAVSSSGVLTTDQLPLAQRPEGSGVLFQYEFSRAAVHRSCPELPELQDVWLLCTYDDGACTIRFDGADALCTIDKNGLMCMRSENGEVASWLVRVEQAPAENVE